MKKEQVTHSPPVICRRCDTQHDPLAHTLTDCEREQIDQASTPPFPGQLWPEQNCIYIGVMRSADGQSAWHLILPVGEQYNIEQAIWGCYGKLIPGADCRSDGLANTIAMAAAGSEIALKAIADECYIPSRAEAALLYAIAAAEFETDNWYLTSTQYSEIYAWTQLFSNGYQGGNRKSSERRCRFVRRLVIQSFNPLEVAGVAQ